LIFDIDAFALYSDIEKLADHLKSNCLNFNQLAESFNKKLNDERRMVQKLIFLNQTIFSQN
jgi:hypothetical protein